MPGYWEQPFDPTWWDQNMGSISTVDPWSGASTQTILDRIAAAKAAGQPIPALYENFDAAKHKAFQDAGYNYQQSQLTPVNPATDWQQQRYDAMKGNMVASTAPTQNARQINASQNQADYIAKFGDAPDQNGQTYADRQAYAQQMLREMGLDENGFPNNARQDIVGGVYMGPNAQGQYPQAMGGGPAVRQGYVAGQGSADPGPMYMTQGGGYDDPRWGTIWPAWTGQKPPETGPSQSYATTPPVYRGGGIQAPTNDYERMKAGERDAYKKGDFSGFRGFEPWIHAGGSNPQAPVATPRDTSSQPAPRDTTTPQAPLFGTENPNQGLTPLRDADRFSIMGKSVFSGSQGQPAQNSLSNTSGSELPSFQPGKLPGEAMPGGVPRDKNVAQEVRRQMKGFNFGGINGPTRFTT